MTVRDRKRGFTLVELLVVIAIISFLMAQLMPAFPRVRRQPRSLAYLSSLEHI
mgnify:CR=1 FL=1